MASLDGLQILLLPKAEGLPRLPKYLEFLSQLVAISARPKFEFEFETEKNATIGLPKMEVFDSQDS